LAFAACGTLGMVMMNVGAAYVTTGGPYLNHAIRGLKQAGVLVTGIPNLADSAGIGTILSGAGLSRYKRGSFIHINSRRNGQSRAADDVRVEYDPPAKRVKTTHPIMNAIGH